MPGAHVFVDETKRGGFLIAAVLVQPQRLQAARALMRGQLLANQSHLHFTKERDDRRKQVVSLLCGFGVQAEIYRAGTMDQRKAREACLQRLVVQQAAAGAHRLVIEEDESRRKADQAVLYTAVRLAQAVDRLRYDLVPKRSEPLLWMADAVAWCWSHGQWQEAIRPIVTAVHSVP